MTTPTRRAVLARLMIAVAATLTALAGCSEQQTVVVRGASGSKRNIKGREEAEAKARASRGRKGR